MRECLNCRGTGKRSWPQSRNTNPRNPLEREPLPPQITKCGACAGTGRILTDADSLELTGHYTPATITRESPEPN